MYTNAIHAYTISVFNYSLNQSYMFVHCQAHAHGFHIFFSFFFFISILLFVGSLKFFFSVFIRNKMTKCSFSCCHFSYDCIVFHVLWIAFNSLTVCCEIYMTDDGKHILHVPANWAIISLITVIV